MKKNLLAKAIELADRKAVKPAAVVVSAAKPEFLSERLYTRVTPTEMKRLKARIGQMMPISGLLRDLLLQYLDNKDAEHGHKKK